MARDMEHKNYGFTLPIQEIIANMHAAATSVCVLATISVAKVIYTNSFISLRPPNNKFKRKRDYAPYFPAATKYSINTW
jgi:hypothetical protein